MIDHNILRAGSVTMLALTFSALPAIAATERQLDSHEHGHAQLNMAISGREVLAELITPAANVVGFEHSAESEEDKKAVSDASSMLAKGEELLAFNAAAECTLQAATVESELIGDDHDDHHGDHDDHDDDKHDHDDHDGEEKHDDHDDDKHDHDDHDGEEKHDDHDDDKHDHDDHDGEEKHDDHDHDKHDDHDDDKHDDHDGEDKHDDHDHDHDGHSDEVHSEFHVTWVFNCEHPEDLTAVQVQIFDAFSGFEEIDASVAGESEQSSVELSPEQREIKL
ncbi:MAG: DUF2796 domain-containing protein [Pseudomonadota bacterium]